MFQQLPAPDKVVAVAFCHAVSKDDIRNYESILEEKLDRYETLSLCVDFHGVSDLTADALVEGAKADIELFGHLKQVSRIAMVSDKEWPRAMVSIMKPFMQGVDIRTFPQEERDQAVSWAAGAD